MNNVLEGIKKLFFKKILKNGRVIGFTWHEY